MPTAVIGDQRIPLPDNWGQMSAPEQQATIDKLEQFHKIAPGPEAPDQFRSAVLPLKVTGQGKLRPDWGLLGTIARPIYDAAILPGQMANAALPEALAVPADSPYFSGREPVIDPATGRPSAHFMERAESAADVLGMSPSPAAIAGRRQMMPTPSTQQLADTNAAQMNAIRASGFEATGQAVGDMGTNLRQSLEGDGFFRELAPKTHAIIDRMEPPAAPIGASVNVRFEALDAMRRRLQGVATGRESSNEEIAAAVRGIRHIEGMLDNLQPSQQAAGALPAQEVARQWRDARGNFAAAKRSNAITGELDPHVSGIQERAQLTADSTYSGRNLDNALRRRVASFLMDEHNVLGFRPDEIEALTAVARGSATQNQVRLAANKLGGGGGMGSVVSGGALGGLTTGAALAAGVEPGVAATLGGAAGGLGMATGSALKRLENMMADSNIRAVAERLRQRSPMYENRLPFQDPASSATGIGGNLGARDLAVMRALMPGLLNPNPGEEPWAPGRRLPPGFI